MRYLSVCSGIEAATLAWHPLGWEPVAFSEIESFPSAVLAHHYPHIPNWGDMTKFKEWPDEAINLLVGGTPCQSFSVAGLRRGLADPRGNLALTYLAIAERYRPDWLVWENVPGVLSADKGRAFGALLGGMEELGYGWAYRTLDAQFFGVAQRRRRVFVVASTRGWAAAASVLFEPESLRGDPAPSREEGQKIAPCLDARAGASGETDFNTSGGLISGTLHAGTPKGDNPGREDQLICMAHGQANAEVATERSPTLSCNHEAPIVCATDDRTHALTGEGFDASEDGTGRGTPVIAFDCKTSDPARGVMAGNIAGTLRSMSHKHSHTNAGGHAAVCFHENQRSEITCNDTAGAINAGGGKPGQGYPAVHVGMRVRRLTPVECERLQGMPDNYTRIPWRNRYLCITCGETFADSYANGVGGLAPAECPRCGEEERIMPRTPDGPRYKAIGNSMAVPVMAWIGRRIDAVAIALPGRDYA